MEPLPADPALLIANVRELLKQTFGAKAEITDYTIIRQQPDYMLMAASVRPPSIEVFLKLAGPHAPLACPFEQTAHLHRLLASHTKIRIPAVYAADSRYRTWPWRYIICEHVSGMEWAKVYPHLSIEEGAYLHAQLGDAVAQIHEISFAEFGEFTPNGQVEGGKAYLAALYDRAKTTIVSHSLGTLFSTLLQQHAEIFDDVQGPALCHDDLHRHNLLVREVYGRWQLVTILDFDKAWAGYPESDLARLEFWEGMTSDEFRRAYENRRHILPSYERRRPIYQLLWCLEYAKNTEKHLADTNRLCRLLGLPIIDRFSYP